jgi:hypothetical protein
MLYGFKERMKTRALKLFVVKNEANSQATGMIHPKTL